MGSTNSSQVWLVIWWKYLFPFPEGHFPHFWKWCDIFLNIAFDFAEHTPLMEKKNKKSQTNRRTSGYISYRYNVLLPSLAAVSLVFAEEQKCKYTWLLVHFYPLKNVPDLTVELKWLSMHKMHIAGSWRWWIISEGIKLGHIVCWFHVALLTLMCLFDVWLVRGVSESSRTVFH